MDDEKIIELFSVRSENALRAVREKYGSLMLGVAKKITGSEADAEECLNDALLNLWKSIPPAAPRSLRAYSCQVIRNLAFKRLTYSLAEKRNANSNVAFDELETVIFDGEAEAKLENVDFSVLLDGFLRSLGKESRVVFMKRYFFMDSIEEISRDLNISQSKVKSLLWRARQKLRNSVYKE